MITRTILAAAALTASVAYAAPPTEKAVISRITLVPPALTMGAKGGVDIHVRILNANRDVSLSAVTYVLRYTRRGKPEKSLRPDTVALAPCAPLAVCELLTITDAPLAEAQQLKIAIEVVGAKFKPR